MSNNNESSGVGLGGVLFVVFLVLKLTHNIAWSWWWVTSPLWIPWLVIGGVFVIVAFFASMKQIFTKPKTVRAKDIIVDKTQIRREEALRKLGIR